MPPNANREPPWSLVGSSSVEPDCTAGSGKKNALAIEGITDGANYKFGTWPPAGIKVVMITARPSLVAEARAEHVGRRVATYRVEVRLAGEGESAGADEGADVVALFTGTVYRRPRSEPGHGTPPAGAS